MSHWIPPVVKFLKEEIPIFNVFENVTACEVINDYVGQHGTQAKWYLPCLPRLHAATPPSLKGAQAWWNKGMVRVNEHVYVPAAGLNVTRLGPAAVRRSVNANDWGYTLTSNVLSSTHYCWPSICVGVG